MLIFEFPIILTIFIALILLAILIRIDLRDRLLPNIYVFPLGALGITFHFLTHFSFSSIESIALGAFAGAGMMLIVRYPSNLLYKQDTLGLGDVKLIGAAGLWLGIEHIYIAITIGALLGLLHGLGYAIATKTWELSKLSIPAGPGFIGGIILTAGYKFLWT